MLAKPLRKPLPCWSLFTEGHVTYDGRVSACCFDHDGRFDMGDLTRQSFIEAWNGERFQALRRANLAEDVERRHAPARVQALDDPDGVVELRPGDVAGREPFHDRPRNGGQRADERALRSRHPLAERIVRVRAVESPGLLLSAQGRDA